ncbi:hypothetical protein MKQ70_31035 [Chitinophaga sedimenti]|uniref:hypothetical protein n=1 Tax=Chitinophaga sedimenti TaxID=2033606 RepID=UPI002002A385|nr:hypothetical protein [Chitinophaga sedimenti]MCK7559168.1 hypothetical protein [Chitinophaga sedimenti]
MEQENFSYEDSLRVITQTIAQVKERVLNDGFEYMLWGLLVSAAALIQYALLKLHMPYHWLGWMVLMPLGAL